MNTPAQQTSAASCTDRLQKKFAELKDSGRAGLVTFVTAFDPTPDLSLKILTGLPAAGADIIELGMPFTDPMADGPAIQLANQRALKQGVSLLKVLDLVQAFRRTDDETPVILMGYYNPIYKFGVDHFIASALQAGIDGVIVVDLPPEADNEMCLPALEKGLHFIRLTAPTTDDVRLPTVLEHTSGFVYYVSLTGITGVKDVDAAQVAPAVERLKRHTDLPVAVGFGIKTPEHAAEIAKCADAVVVGSAIINRIADNLDEAGEPKPALLPSVLEYVSSLAKGVKEGRKAAVK